MKKEDLFATLRGNTYVQYDMPEMAIGGITYPDRLRQFVEMTESVGGHVLDEVSRMGAAAALARPDQARQWVLDALNERMSQAWQLKFTRVDIKITLLNANG